MKVCHILSGDLWGGAEVQTVHLLRALASRKRCSPVAILFNDRETAQRLRGEEIDVHVVREEGRRGPAFALSAAALLRSIAPDIVHSHGYKENLVTAFARSRLTRQTPIVRTQHSTPFPRTTARMRFYSFLDRLAARGFDRTIAVSDSGRNELERFLSSSRIAMIPNGIPTPEFDSSDIPLKREDDVDLVIGSAGRLEPEKRYDLLIEAVAILLGEGIRCRLCIVGDGTKRPALEKLARSIAPNAVLFAGFQENVFSWLSAFDVYALSSEREGLPVTLLEALACRLPVAATSVGGIPEVICHGESGLLVQPGDAPALAQAIARLHADRPAALRMGTAGREIVRRRFSIERVAADTETLYDTLLGGRSDSIE